MKKLILFFFFVLTATTAHGQMQSTGFTFEDDFTMPISPDESADVTDPSSNEDVKFHIDGELSADDMKSLKSRLSRQGFVVMGPGISGGGNLVVGEFLLMARQSGIAENILLAWQQQGHLNVTEVDLQRGTRSVLWIQDRQGQMILLNRNLWQATSRSAKLTAIRNLRVQLQGSMTQ